MKKINLFISAVTLTVAMTAQKTSVVVSDKTGWHKIGETTVDLKGQTQEVKVVGSNKFSSLKFKVLDSPIEIQDIDLYFDEGDKQTIAVGYPIKNAGEESREIPLQGGSERNLNKVIFRYKSIPGNTNTKAKVEIWGMKTNTDKSKT